METSAAEISVEDSSDKAKDDKDDSTSMDTSELDASKENSLSVSLFVHTDDIQDDLDDDLKEAAAAAAAEAAAKNQEKEEEKSVQGDGQKTLMFRIFKTLCQVTKRLMVKWSGKVKSFLYSSLSSLSLACYPSECNEMSRLIMTALRCLTVIHDTTPCATVMTCFLKTKGRQCQQASPGSSGCTWHFDTED